MGMIKNACDSAHFECCLHTLNSAVVGLIHLAMETQAAVLSVPLFPWIVSSVGQRLFLFSKHLNNTNNNIALQLPAELHLAAAVYKWLLQDLFRAFSVTS